ncbi:hypothetical protein [Paraburkholderia sp. JHI869]|uniref:hypothetical protein n=1 Tax=Paraburkholderia sp. JHI869 TaxID=3112959 RepID=UPI00316CA2D3
MADGILPPRPARVTFFRPASDDDLVDVEQFIVAYCTRIRAERVWYTVRGKRRNWQCNPVQLRERRCRYGRTLPYGGHLRMHVMDEMRAEVEGAARAGLLTLRDRLGHILTTLPNRGQFDPFAGVYVRGADLEAFAEVHWDVRKQPEADAQSTVPAAAVHVSRAERQEARVLEVIRALGFDPLALPPTKGKSGVKAKVWVVCSKEAGLLTRSSFEHAWERLRADKRIQGGK